jgi:nucleotide-binding universal stress UspA family protein
MAEAPMKVSIEKVLFATDFSSVTPNAFSYAVAITNRYLAKLVVAHVINLESFELLDDDSARQSIEQARAEAVRKIDQLLDPLHLPQDRYEVAVSEGEISEALMGLIEQRHIDVAVLGTHGRRAFKKLMMGSIAEEVFRMAPCPVLTVGTKAKPASGEMRHILYPVHFAPDFSKAAAYAILLAERFGAKLTVMNVRDDMPESANVQADVTEPVERWMNDHIAPGSDLRNRVRFEAGSGPAANALLDFVQEAGVDLIVMAARRLDPVIAAHLPKADTAYELVSRASCPVLTVGE